MRLLHRSRKSRINGLHYVKHLRLKESKSLRHGQSSVAVGCTYREDSAVRNRCAFIPICHYSSRGNTPGCGLLESSSHNKIIHPGLGSESICPLFSENTSQVMRSMRLHVNLHAKVATTVACRFSTVKPSTMAAGIDLVTYRWFVPITEPLRNQRM